MPHTAVVMSLLAGPRRRLVFPIAGLLLSIAAFPPAAVGEPKLPAAKGAPQFSWSREPLLRTQSPLDVDSLVFAGLPQTIPAGRSSGANGEAAADLYRRGIKKSNEAAANDDDPGRYTQAARLFLQAYAASRYSDGGFFALSMAARSYFHAKRYLEADGIAKQLITRAGAERTALPYYLVRAEALAARGNYLAARECFRRALRASWNGKTRTKISLRIASMSFLMGNLAFAEPAYRKILAQPGALEEHPFAALHFGETLIAAGKNDEALSLFRRIEKGPVPAEAAAAAFRGEGDILLMRNDVALARYAYDQARVKSGLRKPGWWARCREADVAFAEGRFADALAGYRAVKDSPDPSWAREGWYKTILTLYLLSDHEGVVRESRNYLARYGGTKAAEKVRRMQVASGAHLLRAAVSRDPAAAWPLYSSLLFSMLRVPEGKALFRAFGREWERARLFAGASAFYAAAEEPERSGKMRALEAMERRYARGQFDRVAASWSAAEKSAHPPAYAAWLAAKSFFRRGEYGRTGLALSRMEPLPAGPGQKPSDLAGKRELAAVASGMQGNWAQARKALAEIDSPSPFLRCLAVLAETKVARAGKAADASGNPGPAGSSELWAEIARGQARYRRLMAADGD